jgi:hypothetical protein
MKLYLFLRWLNDRSDDCIRNQKEKGLKGANVIEPNVTFFDSEGRELELVAVDEEGDDVTVEFRRTP